MENISQYHEIAAATLARIFLGVLFLFQGYDALFKVKVSNVILAYEDSLKGKGIPKFLTVCGSWFTSCAEFTGGLLLIFGLFEYQALLLVGIDLIIASIGFGIMTPMWDMRFVFPRLALVLFLMVIPPSWNLWSIDGIFNCCMKN